MIDDEQPYSKEDHDLHDAYEEIAKLRTRLAATEATLKECQADFKFDSKVRNNQRDELLMVRAELVTAQAWAKRWKSMARHLRWDLRDNL